MRRPCPSSTTTTATIITTPTSSNPSTSTSMSTSTSNSHSIPAVPSQPTSTMTCSSSCSSSTSPSTRYSPSLTASSSTPSSPSLRPPSSSPSSPPHTYFCNTKFTPSFSLVIISIVSLLVLSTPSFAIPSLSSSSSSSSSTSSSSSSSFFSLPSSARAARPTLATARFYLSGTRYKLKTGFPFGCAGTIFHLEDSVQPLTSKSTTSAASNNIFASTSFASIRTNGASCMSKRRDNRMDLASISFVKGSFGNLAGLSKRSINAIDLAGIDLSLRLCGDFEEAQPLQYFFTKNFSPIYQDLLKKHLPKPEKRILNLIAEDEESRNDSEDGESDFAWMVSMPQVDDGNSFRVCVYRAELASPDDPQSTNDPPTNTDKKEEKEKEEEPVVPTPSPAPEEEEPTPTPEVTQPVEVESASPSPSPRGNQGSTFGQAGTTTTDDVGSEKSSSPACFPGASQVTLSDGTKRTLDTVRVGDRVIVGTNNEVSTVFAFTHAAQHELGDYITFMDTTGKDLLSVSAGHYIKIWPNGGLKKARDVENGEALMDVKGRRREIGKMKWGRQKGIFNVQTLHGDVVVDDMVVSTYTEAVNMKTAHALLAPIRAAYRWWTVGWRMTEQGVPQMCVKC